MRLQTRVLWIISVVTVAMMAIGAAFLWPLVLANYQRLESREVTGRTQQVRNALLHEVHALGMQMADWANWDDTAAFLRTGDAAYRERNILTPVTYTALGIDYLGFHAHQQEPLLFGYDGTAVTALQGAAWADLVTLLSRVHEARAPGMAGVMRLGGQPVLFSLSQVLDSEGDGPSPGYLFMARRVDERLQADLAGLTLQTLQLQPADPLASAATSGSGIAVRVRDADVVEGIFVLADLDGNPVLQGTVSMQRATSQLAREHLMRVGGLIIVFGLLVVIVNYAALSRHVIRRIQRLHRAVARIQDESGLLGVPGHDRPDEIGQLTHEFNALLQRLAGSRRELEAARTQAEAINAARGRFLANMSHEIRTPMTAILGYSELLADNPKLDDQTRHYIKVIQDNSELLLTLVNDILDLSRIEAGKLAVSPVAVDVAGLAADSVQFFAERAAVKGIALRCEMASDLPRSILVDPVRLRQILLNLVSNAVKFTERGHVIVRAAAADGQLVLTVEDTGIGIAPQELGHVFDLFWQADTDMHHHHSGAGLGLVISRQLARLMGGDIVAASRPADGTAFTVMLPLVPADAAAGASASGSVQRLHGHVLLAEDNDVNRLLLRTLLEKFGLTVTAVSNGEQALEKLLGDCLPVDLVLMDMMMPVLDGVLATRRLRAAGFSKPIVALSASAMPEERILGLEAGCTDFAGKPISQAALQALCERHIP